MCPFSCQKKKSCVDELALCILQVTQVTAPCTVGTSDCLEYLVTIKLQTAVQC